MDIKYIFSACLFGKRMIKVDYIQIALSNLCNLRCKICIQSEKKFNKINKKFMEDDIFENIISGIKRGLFVDSLFLFWNDEPTLHPNFDIYLRKLLFLLESNHLGEIIISTNGTFLNRYGKLLASINNPKVKIILSIDGSNEAIYRKIRGGNFQKLLENIEFFLRLRGDKKSPYIIYQMVLTNENFKNIEEFKKIFSDLNYKYSGRNPKFTFLRDIIDSDTIYIKCPFPWGDSVDYDISKERFIELSQKYGFSEAKKEAEMVAIPRGINICRNMFKGIVVHPDGGVSPCCIDFDNSINFGNLNKKDIFDIYCGKVAEKYRDSMIENNLEILPERCRACLLPEGSIINRDKINYDNINFS